MKHPSINQAASNSNQKRLWDIFKGKNQYAELNAHMFINKKRGLSRMQTVLRIASKTAIKEECLLIPPDSFQATYTRTAKSFFF